MEEKIKELLNELFAQWSGSKAEVFSELPPSGSNRRYFRISGGACSAIGVYNADQKENRAFIGFTQSLKQAGIRVPEIYATDDAYGIYLQQDLGDETLFSMLVRERAANNGEFTPQIKDMYRKVIDALVDIQVKGSASINFDLCYPRRAFDRQSMMWDLQYFKYYFLKLAHIQFDEQLLENDFDTLIDYLLEVEHDYFMYRDFQSRNIMINQGMPWFIDYQGGRYGALQYDLASLLYDAKADIPNDVRRELLDYYLERLTTGGSDQFVMHYYAYVLIRILQAMGAYGYRGFFERKTHFLRSIPFALANLKDLIDNHLPSITVPELLRVLNGICESEELRSIGNSTRLKVRVCSFSYRHGIPVDNSGNGGGFVFDCRALPNPGKYEQYKQFTGRDQEVIDFFEREMDSMKPFIEATRQLVRQSVEKYISRGFTNLAVNFGCTGGQHRSVYCAEQMAQWLRSNYDVDVEVKHWEQR
ncbi:MAG: phosphotransferase [Bacteroidales bacterium]|nr:phosphotransferase [Bacteroidales bacterium]